MLVAADETTTPATNHTATVVTAPERAKFHVYVLMGQSNMVGRDTKGVDQQVDTPRILALNGNGQWVVAREPMHVRGTGIGPGIPFAQHMLEADPSVTIGLVPCAVGGTSLNRWMKGAELYEAAVRRAKMASESGTLKGVLWHQGESDATSEKNATTYERRLTTMLIDLRQDLGDARLPIVIGQIGEFLTKEKQPFADIVRDAIRSISSKLQNVGYADSAGLLDKGDKLHFSADAQREMGVRFAKAMAALQTSATTRSAE
ncbi:MAG: sialate O-acetylesterase [Tepidisphaeraceae bacterium]